MNQHAIIKPTKLRMRIHTLNWKWSQSSDIGQNKTDKISRRAQNNDNMKIAASTRVAILEAFVSKPQAIMQAPKKLLPKYPAGRVHMGMPPDIWVAPLASKVRRTFDG